MRRSISQVEAMLEENPGIHTSLRKQVQSELKEARDAASKRANAGAAERYAHAIASGTAIGQELTTVRDAARKLAADLRAGRLTAAEGTKAWNTLRAQARNLAARNERQAHHVEFLETVEADPVAFIEGLDAKYPDLQERTQHEFSI